MFWRARQGEPRLDEPEEDALEWGWQIIESDISELIPGQADAHRLAITTNVPQLIYYQMQN